MKFNGRPYGVGGKKNIMVDGVQVIWSYFFFLFWVLMLLLLCACLRQHSAISI